jgi:hypothetical protein
MNEHTNESCNNTIWEQGLDALSDALGPTGMVRFLNEHRLRLPKIKDYTAERHKWLRDEGTVAELVKEVEQKERELSLRT